MRLLEIESVNTIMIEDDSLNIVVLIQKNNTRAIIICFVLKNTPKLPLKVVLPVAYWAKTDSKALRVSFQSNINESYDKHHEKGECVVPMMTMARWP